MDVETKFTSDPENCNESQELMHYISRPGITNEEVTDVYEKWAGHYDKTIGNITWNAPKYGADETAAVLKDKKDARILDAAAGTGLSGILLKKMGYTNIDALDASENMLQQAQKTEAYKQFYKAYMGKDRLDIEEDTYDVVMTVGSFVPGHVKEDCYEELARITKPGGHIIIVMCERYFRENSSYSSNIEPRMKVFQEQGIWTQIKRQQVPNYHESYDGIVFILQMNSDKNARLVTLN